MAEPSKSRLEQWLQNGLLSRRRYFSEHFDARLILEQAQRNVRYKIERQNVRSSIT